MTNSKKSGYLAGLLKSGYILHALLFTAITCTIIVLGYFSHLWDMVVSSDSFLIYTLSVLGTFAVLIVVYALCSIKKNKVAITDALSLTMIFTAIFYVVFLFLVIEDIEIFRIVFPAVLFVVGAILLGLNWFFYDPEKQDSNVIYTKNTLSGYYKTIFKKYSFFAILCAAAVCLCFETLIFNPAYALGLSVTEYVLLAILAIPLILYFAYYAGSKKVVALDALLVAITISLAVSLVKVIVTEDFEHNITLWALATFILIVYTFIRYRCFDILLTPEPKEIEKKSVVGYYVKNVLRSYSPLLILSVASVLAMSMFVIFPIDALTRLVAIEGDEFSYATPFLLVSAIDFAVYATLIVFLVFSFVNITIRKTNVGDFMLFALLAFIVFGLITLVVDFSVLKMLILLASLVYTLSVFFARARAVYYAE